LFILFVGVQILRSIRGPTFWKPVVFSEAASEIVKTKADGSLVSTALRGKARRDNGSQHPTRTAIRAAKKKTRPLGPFRLPNRVATLDALAKTGDRTVNRRRKSNWDSF
jgi:hypothetical protein